MALFSFFRGNAEFAGERSQIPQGLRMAKINQLVYNLNFCDVCVIIKNTDYCTDTDDCINIKIK
jgi:hypothetical protein